MNILYFSCIVLVLSNSSPSWGVSLPNLSDVFPEVDQWAGPSQELERSAREINYTAILHRPNGACLRAHRCRGRIWHMMRFIYSFQIEELTNSLASVCPTLDEASCDFARCQTTPRHLMMQRVVARACERQQEFREHSACWAHPFRLQLLPCIAQPINNISQYFEFRHRCFSESVVNLTACSPEGKAFFIEFSAFFLREYQASIVRVIRN